jgi:hypothetical protein
LATPKRFVRSRHVSLLFFFDIRGLPFFEEG